MLHKTPMPLKYKHIGTHHQLQGNSTWRILLSMGGHSFPRDHTKRPIQENVIWAPILKIRSIVRCILRQPNTDWARVQTWLERSGENFMVVKFIEGHLYHKNGVDTITAPGQRGVGTQQNLTNHRIQTNKEKRYVLAYKDRTRTRDDNTKAIGSILWVYERCK